MFDYENMIKRAIRFFPTWSDIRKRYSKSTGGKLLSTITEESVDIEKAIQEYIDSYFLDRIEGHNIVAFSYMATIGIIDDIDKVEVIYDSKPCRLTLDVDEFLRETEDYLSYYENGKIYIREDMYSGNNEITIHMDNNSYLDYELTRIHVWNIYDEFACFIGMERHEGETNEELYQRMLYFNAHKPNSSEEGIKNAIISELMIDCPELLPEDIKVEPVDAINLRKAYKGYNELLDLLNELNRDVYRWKRWDLDEWQYDFKSIEYLPYKWDEVLTKWQNGIGFDDDLQVILSNNVNKTNADITLYSKDKETLNAYIRNKEIYKNVKLTFQKYNQKLNSINVKYRLKAALMKRLDPSAINLSIYSSNETTETLNIQDVYKFGSDITRTDGSKLTDAYRYRLFFTPKNNNYNIEIYRATVSYRHKTTKAILKTESLLKSKDGFVLNSSGNLIATTISKTINSINNMVTSNYLTNVKNGGFTIRDGYTNGSGTVNINGYGNKTLTFMSSCKMSDISHSDIKTKGCLWKGNELLLRTDYDGYKEITIEIEANKFSFTLNTDTVLDFYMFDYDDNKYIPYSLSGAGSVFETEETLVPRKIKMFLKIKNMIDVSLSNFIYNNYSVNLTTANGALVALENDMRTFILPDYIQNKLFIELKTKSLYPPVIESIFIGDDVLNNSYLTDGIPYLNNYDRILDIDCNCNCALIKYDSNDIEIERIENYVSSSYYKATGDEAFIRLNLDEWDEVYSVISETGAIDLIEESGQYYYNLLLANGEIATAVTINGIKHTDPVIVSLNDILKSHFEGYDITTNRVYCSRLTDGLIISTGNLTTDFEIFKIDSSYFKRNNAVKYVFEDIPDDINVIWGTDTTLVDGFSNIYDFNYISFYPVNSEICTAINEYNLFLNEMKDIPMVNNFAPLIDSNSLYFYTVEPYISSDPVDIRFYPQDSTKEFDDLKTWSVGNKSLYIKYDADLFNSEVYEIQETTIVNRMKLSNYMEIADVYNLSDNSVLYTQQYVVVPPENAEIIYKTYDGTEDTADLIIDEIVDIDNYFIKLRYSNVDRIIQLNEYYNYTDYEPYNDYKLLDEQGIIIWPNYENDKERNISVHIRYTIKKPIALVYTEDALYEAVSYVVDAYKELSTYTIFNIENGDRYDLRNLEDFKDCDLVYVNCSEPSFESIMVDTYLKFNKFAEENTILVKTGYYYINGKEYYLFSNDGTLDIDTYIGLNSVNAKLRNGEIETFKSTDNYVRNSAMNLRGMNKLYDFNHNKETLYSISNFGKYTACNSFNEWHTFGSNISLISDIEGYEINDVALGFNFQENWGYAFIDITDYLYDDLSYIGFIAYGIDVYVGIERPYMNTKFNRALNIEIDEPIKSSSYIYTYELEREPDCRYYLVVKKNRYSSYDYRLIDDIIITDNKDMLYSSTVHIKNLDILGLNITNSKTEKTCYRMSINSNKYCDCKGASLCSDGSIKTTSNIDWGLTTISKFETKEEFATCELENLILTNNYVQASTTGYGYLTTPPIYIENPNTVKRLFYKLNNINTNEMSGLKFTIYTCNTKNGNYVPSKYENSNYGFIDNKDLGIYIKAKVAIPAGKILDNLILFAEYRSTKDNLLSAPTCERGELISYVFDTQENLSYKVKSISLNGISNINDVNLYVRASSDKYSADVWGDWKPLKLNSDGELTNIIKWNSARFFQIKVVVNNKDGYIDLNYIDLEVI